MDGSTQTRLSNESIEEIVNQVSRRLRRDLAEVGLGPSNEIDMAGRWEGGELVLRPSSGQEKAIPLETFFRKIVLARERMRVLEQKINNHPKLDDEDRLELQKYLAQIYGSFTTFNVLFEERADWFVGQKSDR